MRKWKHDIGLESRMLFTMFLLGAVYLAFLAFLAASGVNSMFILLFAGVMMFVQYYYSDKMVLWTSGARIVSASEEPELHEIVTRLCAIADIPIPKIAIMNTMMPNAFATGRNKKNAVVAVTTGLMRSLDREELEAVIGHELTHIKNRDMTVLTIASFLSTVAFFIVRYALYFGGDGNKREGNGGLIVVWIVSLIVWAISFLLIRALSRYREFSADRGAAIITGKPSKLASALMKISGTMQKVPSDDLRKVEGMSAFFIIPAISGSSIMQLLSTHPSTEKRLAALEKIEREMGL
ncbi:MAG: zinc metalloprotease HtpX [Methanomethylovorans sp.]|uniref:zinc metalloprotease HtpX n=1 Tax=Methanomethylovorans sp. TaxID=2758717 RepID=UPI000AD7D22F|nr:zinc metalloprotease HtpX [Methanomethylovorans sp.]